MEKKKIITLGILAAITGLFLQLVYLPKAWEVKRLGAGYRKIKVDIAELYNFIGGEDKLKDNLICSQLGWNYWGSTGEARRPKERPQQR